MDNKIEYSGLTDAQIDTAIKDVLEERCRRCDIHLEELLNDRFNITWIRDWIRRGMPFNREDDDWHYQAIMHDCREEIDAKLAAEA